MSSDASISQRDLRMRSREVMDAVEHGERFTVTRDGRPIGELVPLPRSRFVSRADFVMASGNAPIVDIERFHADLDDALVTELEDPYAR